MPFLIQHHEHPTEFSKHQGRGVLPSEDTDREQNQPTNVTHTLGRYYFRWSGLEWFLREDWSEQGLEGMKA